MLPETIAHRWASLLPFMQAGAFLSQSQVDGLFRTDGGWGGLDIASVDALERFRLIRPIGKIFVIAPWTPPIPTALPPSLPAITLWQPWATLVAEQTKPWEFRGHSSPKAYRNRRIAIHAAKRPLRMRELLAVKHRLQAGQASEDCLYAPRAIEVLDRMLAGEPVPLGAVVCTAVLGPNVEAERLAAAIEGRRRLNVATNTGWSLSQVEPLPRPSPRLGKQGWFTWEPAEPG